MPAPHRSLPAPHWWLPALLFALACGRTTIAPVPAPPPPAPAPVAAQAPPTLDEVRPLRTTDPAKYEQLLQALAASSDARIAGRAQALLALFYYDQKRWDDAAAALPKAAQMDAVVAPFLELRLVTADEKRNDVAGAIAAATQIIASFPDAAAAVVARLRLPALYAKSGDTAATDASFKQAIATPVDELSEGEFVNTASRLEAAERRDLATAIRMRLLSEYPQGRFTEDTYDQLTKATASPLDIAGFDDLLSIAQRLARNDRYDQAFDLLGRITRRFPEAAKNDSFRATRLRALFNTRHYSELVNETAAVNNDPAVMLLRARAAWRSDKPEQFLADLKSIEKRFPSSKESIEAKTLRAKYYVTDDVDYEVSAKNLEAAIAAGALGNDGENLWNVGWTYTLWGHYDDALKTFDRYVRMFPDGDYTSNALFWSGKILDKTGKRDERDARWRELIAKYPFSYFSYRARALSGAVMPSVSAVMPSVSAVMPSVSEASGGAGGTNTPPAATQPPRSLADARDDRAARDDRGARDDRDARDDRAFPDVEAQIASAAEPRLDSVRELEWLDLMRDASGEMKRIAAAHPDNLGLQFMLADIYVQGGEPFKANGILQRRFREFVRHGGTGIPHRFWEILFPLNYWPSIRTEAERRNLDPFLIASIIRQESGFEPETVSNAGAVGLMQIMPAEAASIAARGGIEGVTRETLFDPPVNIAVGAAEFSQKLEAMRGDPILAIAAYNAGEEAVGRWLAHVPVDDIDLFVESIPYAETRLYVKTVTRNRFEYRRIYERSMASSQQSQ